MKTAELVAKYRNTSLHQTSDVVSELVGLQLDGPSFFHVGGQYECTLVNEAGYDLPDTVSLWTRYSDGSEVEIVNYDFYKPYTYDPTTGKITLNFAPTGATNVLVIRAEGKENLMHRLAPCLVKSIPVQMEPMVPLTGP